MPRLLGEHLRHEETVVLPLIQRVMSVDDFAAVERAIERSYRLRDTPFLIGWVGDALPAEVLERILSQGGPPFRLLYAVVRRSHARRERRAFRYGGLLTAGIVSLPSLLLIVGILALELLVCAIQAYVFALLTTLYLNDAINLH